MPEIIRRSKAAILHKDGAYAAIAMAITDEHNFVSNFDPRVHPHNYSRSFETPTIAEVEYDESIAKSRDRGWKILYNGQRNFG